VSTWYVNAMLVVSLGQLHVVEQSPLFPYCPSHTCMLVGLLPPVSVVGHTNPEQSVL